LKKVRVFSLKIDGALPVFSGILGSMFVCALIAVHGPGKLARAQSLAAESAEELVSPAEYSVRAAFLAPEKPAADKILEFYRSSVYQEQVVDFFAAICGSRQVAAVILANAAAFNVPPGLAFALCWEESRYNPRAVNRKNRNESIDRGLFQLNNRSFPNVAEADFFNPGINAWYGMGHLRLCLDAGGSEIAALAMYNAGTARVKTQGTPKITLDYIGRILDCRQKIEAIFAAEFPLRRTAPAIVGQAVPGRAKRDAIAERPVLGPAKPGLTPAIAAAKPSRSWLVWLTPLSGNR
jgi:soluble lytic murein transglycosylase-like protein